MFVKPNFFFSVRFLRTMANSSILDSVATFEKQERLIFGSQTFAVAAMKASVSAPESETQKHLAAPDRVARIAQLKARYPGLDITGPLEPSHMLYDHV